MNNLITGAAGFIGFHLSCYLIKQGKSLIAFDNLNDYYDQSLKEARLKNIYKLSEEYGTEFKFIKGNLEDYELLKNIFKENNPQNVINLAAQAGVRYSIENPSAYIQANLVGFGNILECCRTYSTQHLIYASSSSVYGGNKELPFNESQAVDHPVSLYAASKRANELMAHTYSHLYSLPTTGLRFFTVYGPWGRPDMALFLFTKAILNNEPIKIFNNGKMLRDFTYIEDLVKSLYSLISKPPEEKKNSNSIILTPDESWAPFKIFNIGNSNPTPLMDYIKAIEESLGKKAIKEFLPMQPGDVEATSANCYKLENFIGYKPSTSVKEGVSKFIDWYKNYYCC
tara:strand:- start:1977 stop:2999 length:1023 start_codon:yes stop_codon:yes gene_type:complete